MKFHQCRGALSGLLAALLILYRIVNQPGPNEIVTDLAHEAMSAAQSFSLLALPGPTIQVAQDSRRARQAANNEAFFQALGEGVAQSKTMQRQPAAAQSVDEGPGRRGDQRP